MKDKVIFGNKEQRDKLANLIHYPDCWDTVTYPSLYDAVYEILAWNGCNQCLKNDIVKGRN